VKLWRKLGAASVSFKRSFQDLPAHNSPEKVEYLFLRMILLSLNSAASSATQGSMIVSPTKNVHLDSGTQMLLSASGHAREK